jgi:hypothetical protein
MKQTRGVSRGALNLNIASAGSLVPTKQAKTTKNSMSHTIQRGKEDADALHNYLPIFQKKLKEPAKALNSI